MDQSNIDIEKLKHFISENAICKRCVGRIIDNTPKFQNKDHSLKIQVNKSLVEGCVDEINCSICKGAVIKSIEILGKLIYQLEKWEYNTFLVGIQLMRDYIKSDKILTEAGFEFRPLKVEIAQELTIRIKEITGKLNNIQNPDITIVIQIKDRPRFKLQIKSLFILGRYKKLVRGIPQTKWPCTHCKGKGCDACNFTGQQYPHSVELIVAEPFINRVKCSGTSFHGAGREDIDALMLGKGRPFVLELKNPRVRSINLEEIKNEVNATNMVEINSLRFTDRSIVRKIKTDASNTKKIYRAKIELEKTAKQEDIVKLSEFGSNTIELMQRTPIRVSHRRADKIRRKKIYKMDVLSFNNNYVEVKIEAQGGAYIKEFISGDSGRTKPSIAEYLNTKAVCIELDVLEVDDKGLF